MVDIKSRLAAIPAERLRKLAQQLKKSGPASSAITRQPRISNRFPLALAQERLWFLTQLEPSNPAYNNGFAFRKVIATPEWRTLPVIDLRHLPAGEREIEAKRLAAGEMRKAFDLATGPIFRLKMLRLADDDSIIVGCVHHIVSDGWCADVLTRELGMLYLAFRAGSISPLPEPPLQYVDYAVWQRERMQGETQERLLSYWKKQLADIDLLPLPIDHPRPAMQTSRGASLPFAVPSALSRTLKKLGREEGATPFIVLLTALYTLLHRWTGSNDITVGTPFANRGRSELESVIGFFVNTLVLRADLAGEPSFRTLLRRVNATCVEAYEHQEVPFERLVDELHLVRDLTRNPLFQVNFQFSSTPKIELPDTSAFSMSVFPVDMVVAKFDLELAMWEGWDGFVRLGGMTSSAADFGMASSQDETFFGTMIYNADLFERETIQRMMDHFVHLLGGIAADPDQTIDALPMLAESVRHQLLYEWNATKTEFPSDKCVHQLFEEQATRTPDATALVFEDESLSYAELNQRANRLAHGLQALGVKPDICVAICAERSIEMVVALLAVLKAGGAYVPLDPTYPLDRLRFMLEDCAPIALLTQSHLAELFSDMTTRPQMIDLVTTSSWEHQPVTNPDPNNSGLTSNHLAYVIYTSGSTGNPKGCMLHHRGVVNRLVWMQRKYQLNASEAVLQKTPFGFDVSVWEFFWTLMAGAKLVMARPEGHKDPDYLTAMIRQHSITTMHFVPSMLQVFLEHTDSADLPSLVRVVCSGEALPATLLWRFQQQLPHAELHNLYGPTEASVDVTAWSCRSGIHPSVVPIGKPIANTQMYVLDSHSQPVPIGVTGEIYIGGVQVARGYLNRPELTVERFLENPFSDEPGARMYRTGDLGRWLPDGNIEYLGRNDFQVKLRGFRIELGEIEARLAEHEAVREAVVIAREDTQGDKRLVAYYTGIGEPDAVNAEQLRSHLVTSLPEYMIPAAYVRLESFPLTTNGKLDRKALPAPDMSAYTAPSYEQPQGEIETKLARIWAEVLHVDQVGRNDNFFALGGHSLLAVTLIERVRRSGFAVDVRDLFATPTLAELAATVGRAVPPIEIPPNRIPLGCNAIVPEMLPLVNLTQEEIDRVVSAVPGGVQNVQDIYPLAPLQEGILFHHLMSGQGDPYLLVNQMSFDSRARLDGYIAALQAVIDRHDILRTAVLWDGLPEPVQVVWRKARLYVEEIELKPRPNDSARELYERYNPRHFRIDVRRAPMMQIYIAEDHENGRWLMQQLLHHLVDDNTSLRKLLAEIQAHLLGQQDRLPAPLPYRNLVAQARLGISRDEHEVFFRQLLGDIDEPTAPFGLLNVQNDGCDIEEACLNLKGDFAQRIRNAARRSGVSAASLFHLAWAHMLAKVSGREEVVFGTVLFGRLQGGQSTELMLGLFINTLPVRISVGTEPAEVCLRRTHTMLADLLRHEYAPLSLALRCSGVSAPAPLFTALLNYRHTPSSVHEFTAEETAAWAGVHKLREEERTNYPFILAVDDHGKDFVLTAQTVASIGSTRVCELMRTALASLVDALDTSSPKPMRELDVVPQSERHQLLIEWNDTMVSFAGEKSIARLIEEQAARTPDAIAVVYEHDVLSYAQLNQRANQLAHYLTKRGVGSDVLVGLCLDRSTDMAIGILGILKSGGAYVPLDPSFPQSRLSHMVEDSQMSVLLTHRDLEKRLDLRPSTIVRLDADWNEIAILSTNSAGLPHTDGRNRAYVLYTSGSTGKPKGVEISHFALVNFLLSMQREPGFRATDTLLAVTTLSFDIAGLEIYLPLLTGGRVVLASREDTHDPKRLIKMMDESECTVMQATPATWRALIEAGWAGSPGLKVLCGGEALLPDLAGEILSRCKELWNMYGPTETTVWSAIHRVTTASGAVPIGKPIANTQVYILDAQRTLVPLGAVGELYIGGDGLARGYLHREELTRERFVANPFVQDGRLYRTGDLARWLPDGRLACLGRLDHQVKIRGFRIELGEIEARLAEHDAVREAVVVVREDTPGDKRLVAYYTLSPFAESEGDSLCGERLRSHLSASLPDYMVPAVYVRLNSLPLTPNGKLDRKALPAPELDVFSTRGYEPPQGETETMLAEVWAEVLKLDRVGRHDNFFELGGHSLLTMRTISLLEKRGVEIAVSDIFTHPTVISLGEHITGGRRDTPNAAISLRASGTEPPLFLVHDGRGELIYAHLLIRHIDNIIPVYGLPIHSEVGPQPGTIKDMAARMVRMMRAVQPSGPYRVAGWSFGGTLAHEIAAQLLNDDQMVEFIGLLDTYYAPHFESLISPIHNETDMLLSQLQIENSQDEDLQIALATLRLKADTIGFAAVVGRCQQMLIIPSDVDISSLKSTLALQLKLQEINVRHIAQPLTVPVHFFTAQGGPTTDPLRGWGRILPKDLVQTITIGGTHHSMLQSPHIETLGKALSSAILEVVGVA
ncbi:MAG: amino acid adenylation domain-containing protein [Terracidiphilus sp.]